MAVSGENVRTTPRMSEPVEGWMLDTHTQAAPGDFNARHSDEEMHDVQEEAADKLAHLTPGRRSAISVNSPETNPKHAEASGKSSALSVWQRLLPNEFDSTRLKPQLEPVLADYNSSPTVRWHSHVGRSLASASIEPTSLPRALRVYGLMNNHSKHHRSYGRDYVPPWGREDQGWLRDGTCKGCLSRLCGTCKGPFPREAVLTSGAAP
ncbi:hypothetical protein BC834DRAFT_1035416 [Gloeopeniophorella convolvens]|nr:hypothetical protein BC834DRAFT_1036179 [Gloeopeniophorella convolvens]KAI0260269.1 hypothetical protein BC834DRAFT_1035416 [Gloeopeniophorella convolvens]